MKEKHEINCALLKPVVKECVDCGSKKIYYFKREKLENWELKKYYVGICSNCGKSDILVRTLSYGKR